MNRTVLSFQMIRRALAAIGLDGSATEQLLLRTALQRSKLRNIRREGGGSALVYFQMDSATNDDIWRSFPAPKAALATCVRTILPTGAQPSARLLIPHSQYAAAICRLH